MQPHNPPFDCTYATLGICTGFEWDILQQIDCGIALYASDGQTLVKFNPAFASLHGYAVAQQERANPYLSLWRAIAALWGPNKCYSLANEIIIPLNPATCVPMGLLFPY